jgi:prophage tail gpP-like protein
MAFSLKIQGTEFQNFQDFKLDLVFNSIASAFSFKAFVDFEDPKMRSLFRPFSYRKVAVFADGRLVLTGVILNHKLIDDGEPNMIAVSGYSVTGVLQDSSIPISTYPLQSDKKTIAEITTNLIEPFGLSLSNQTSEADVALDTSTANATDSVAAYLNKLCAQKNIVLTHNAAGQVVLKQVVPGRSIGFLQPGSYTSIELSCKGQGMHDQLTALRQASSLDPSEAESSVRNPFIVEYSTAVTPSNPYIPNFRPLVKEQTSDSEDSTSLVVQNMLASELRNITFGISLPSWYIGGQLAQPEQVITIDGTALNIRGHIDLFIESVSFKGSPSEQIAELGCVLPQVYNGQTPENFFL